MSAAFRKDGRFQIYVPNSAGGLVQRSTESQDPAIERGMRRMIEALRDGHRWAILDRLAAPRVRGDRPLTLARLYAAYVADPTLKAFEAALVTPDVVPLVPRWLEALDAELGTRASGDRSEFEAAVREFLGDRCAAGEITAQRAREWLTTTTGSSSTRRAKLYRIRSFVRWLVERGTLSSNPIRDVRAPRRGKPRIRYESSANDLKISEAAPTPTYRLLFALVHGTGLDLSPALSLKRRDLDLEAGTVRGAGTKTRKRERHLVEIEPWALPIIRETTRLLTPNAPLFPGITRHMAHHHHAATCALDAVAIEDYTLRDARHSWAVRARLERALSFEDIADHLGTSVYLVATTYARFSRPTTTPVTTQTSADGRTSEAGGNG